MRLPMASSVARGRAIVVLKRLSRAIEDGDSIHAVIVGTAINQDGHTNGISLPSAEAQARLVRDACRARWNRSFPDRFCRGSRHRHGGGRSDRGSCAGRGICARIAAADAPLAIGSVKTNLGHLETAAGIAGLVKAALVLKHGQIPASLHFEKPNPHIDFTALKLRVPTTLEAFPKTGGRPDGGREFVWLRGFKFACDSRGAAAASARNDFGFRLRPLVAAHAIRAAPRERCAPRLRG